MRSVKKAEHGPHLNGLTTHRPPLLRGLQAMPLAADAEVVEQAFEEALLRLSAGLRG